MKINLHLLLRWRCWLNGICYRHKQVKPIGGFSLQYMPCDQCQIERAERRARKRELLIQQAEKLQK
jgi:hypothetical protein